MGNLKIGVFEISEMENGNFWIKWDNEGMEVSEAELEAWIKRFYQINF